MSEWEGSLSNHPDERVRDSLQQMIRFVVVEGLSYWNVDFYLREVESVRLRTKYFPFRRWLRSAKRRRADVSFRGEG